MAIRENWYQMTNWHAPKHGVETIHGKMLYKDWLEREVERVTKQGKLARVITRNGKMCVICEKKKKG